mmetsp:Transcript_47577/g.149041  ORF Transcript_47577/g.149041 Transcript_47577/m.149041 type:complete len:287 (+) Transcript_47577:1967-2827(+)
MKDDLTRLLQPIPVERNPHIRPWLPSQQVRHIGNGFSIQILIVNFEDVISGPKTGIVCVPFKRIHDPETFRLLLPPVTPDLPILCKPHSNPSVRAKRLNLEVLRSLVVLELSVWVEGAQHRSHSRLKELLRRHFLHISSVDVSEDVLKQSHVLHNARAGLLNLRLRHEVDQGDEHGPGKDNGANEPREDRNRDRDLERWLEEHVPDVHRSLQGTLDALLLVFFRDPAHRHSRQDVQHPVAMSARTDHVATHVPFPWAVGNTPRWSRNECWHENRLGWCQGSDRRQL